jgi:nanoRNase/pAp phosphatase (c-di-AMP/oligoRNAs hydrolase)
MIPMSRGEIRPSLERAFEGCRRALVLTHDNPDPDALASGFALRELLNSLLPLEATLGFAGMIGRAENRAMVQVLDIGPTPLTTLSLDEFDGVALVDTQPGTGNNSLPESLPLRAVIDHHPRREGIEAPHIDIRTNYGATATMMTEYASVCGMQISQALATALFYAIRSETQDLGREASEPDRMAYFYLLARADMGAVAQIQRARVPRDYFRAFRDAVDKAEVAGNIVITDLGNVGSADMVAEIADFLLRLQGAEWSIAIGRNENMLTVSVRTTDPYAHAGRIIREAVRGLGTAGGHGTMAGGQIPVNDKNQDELTAQVRNALLRVIGVSDDAAAAEPLLR